MTEWKVKHDCNPYGREMFEKESIQRFIEGLKLAASCAKEMNALKPKEGWGKVAEAIYHMVAQGRKLSKAKGLTRNELLLRTDRIQKTQDPMTQQS